ncbi:MAG: HAMP domain-containing sensor histidine kinase [Schaalia hyovaginalis]|uniref:HAMP domain-containing sensor histidine kinase n=1 Tax=Schaalia hyovaginalis TaxID=29316 RepID=UPI0012B2C316|nr:HAMP domain-containing sensor histidine kinase [Schaalia hyovaginalis]MDY6213847.1 HAMP domain-containing sensor histidine kinase [Schaalia hyovaginalis]MST64845.1 HAMP domain-containing histidine kinase [Schaalia hyovaginalis]
MRRRATDMILAAVAVVALLMGIPGAAASSYLVWAADQEGAEARVEAVVRTIDRRIANEDPVDEHLIAFLLSPESLDLGKASSAITTRVTGPLFIGETPKGPTHIVRISSPSGTAIKTEISAIPSLKRVAAVCGLFIAGMGICLLVGLALARSFSRRLSAPLIYLAAQAEQIGSGQVRAQLKPSGIEEIDLVQEELVRTGERMAGRLAAERQFAADASHQLRTPLTALSMRLEEIELISTEEEVQEEARTCLEQVERLTGVVADLLDANARSAGQTEAIHILEAFNTQREEWEEAFEKSGRQLAFTDEAALPVLADGPKLSQVLATLIENSLRYGNGATRVVARKSANSRGVVIEVCDEGEGVADDLAPDIFEKGVSGHGSTGIGLALARDLAGAMGGRLELTSNHPPVFTLSLAAIPASFDPDHVMPQGPVVSMGRRSRRF